MTEVEKQFLVAMDELWDIEDCWRNRGGIRMLKEGRVLQYDAALLITTLEPHLCFAGRYLGLSCRFKVEAWRPNHVVIHPKNGHARLMMQMYHELYTERELSDGVTEA